ncbi:zinc metallopeptidase [Vagococcus coleopterorum]|uniref:Zinc metallopeptidase n=1 Tax=Vagococcus coleopterorum TaxID=2714946 RepID=A0A6G8AMZ9_9ENTE|nr:zinc metallopeptidase [Vagococcus coleopterorum]QIL46350.1 zinc metallopeptidase [Vagococcus coleopterorum]
MYGFGPMNMMWDRTYILIIIGMVLSMLASAYVSRTFKKYADVKTKKGYTGAQVAQMILDVNNIQNVAVQPIRGELNDNYNSATKILSLSEPVANVQSVSAIGVAAHECGHAVQDAVGYKPLIWRAALVPIANFGTQVSFPLIIAGLFFGKFLITAGIVCFSAALVFQLVTLPVEFNASARALRILNEQEILDQEEMSMARHVLFAAALTYVAAAFASVLQLLRLIMIYGDRRN